MPEVLPPSVARCVEGSPETSLPGAVANRRASTVTVPEGTE